ncbi:MAG: carbohydrate ABC transporter permease [Acidimicrobiia bacterium]|nr:carbohydrate ABC transporter permease [Acidimicrobiia bacterium]
MLIALFPVFWTLSTSVKNRVDTFANPPRFFDFVPTWKNYQNLFDDAQFVTVLKNTLIMTVSSTILCLLIGGLAAYALARRPRFPGRRPLEVGLVLVRAMPGIVLLVPLFNLLSDLGLYDNRLALIALYAAINLPFAIWLLTSFLEHVPYELEESAQVEGANGWQLATRILLPLLGPGLSATAIFIALLSWNEFLIPVILAGESSKTLPVFISGFISNRTLDWGPMAAASSLAIIPIAFLTVVAQRWLVSGLSSGAVKE